jgi:hypothetical protein
MATHQSVQQAVVPIDDLPSLGEGGWYLSTMLVLVLEDVQDVVGSVFVTAQESGTLAALQNRPTFLVSVSGQLGGDCMVATAEFGGVILTVHDDGEEPAQEVAKSLVGSRIVTLGRGPEPSIAPNHQGVGRRHASEKIHA